MEKKALLSKCTKILSSGLATWKNNSFLLRAGCIHCNVEWLRIRAMIKWKLDSLRVMTLLSISLYQQCRRYSGKSLPCSLLSCSTACCSIVYCFLPSIVCLLFELTAVLIVEKASSFVLSWIYFTWECAWASSSCLVEVSWLSRVAMIPCTILP